MKSVKKEMILVIGLLSVFATASLISLCTSCNREPEIEYRDKVVEVEKPVEVIKEVEVVKEIEVEKKVEVPVEVIREVKIGYPVEVEKIVEKEIYVEKSQVDLNGIEVVKLDDNLYEFEFTATQCINDPSQIKKIFDLQGISYYSYSSDFYVFKEGELKAKPGYIIKTLFLANPRGMAAPSILNKDYNKLSPSNISKDDYTGSALKYEYTNIDEEQVQISCKNNWNYYGAEVVRVTFSIR